MFAQKYEVWSIDIGWEYPTEMDMSIESYVILIRFGYKYVKKQV